MVLVVIYYILQISMEFEQSDKKVRKRQKKLCKQIKAQVSIKQSCYCYRYRYHYHYHYFYFYTCNWWMLTERWGETTLKPL